MNSQKRGFTLVELIVVLVILAILAAMLVPALTGYIKRAKEEKDYANYRIPKFYDFKSRDAKERKLYELFCQVNLDIKNMVDEINKFKIK